jgi:hypothetical protein
VRAIDLLVAVATALSFWGVPLVLAIRDMAGLSLSARYTVLAFLIVVMGAIGFAWWRGSVFITSPRLLTTASMLLVIGSGVQVIAQQVALRQRLARDPTIAATQEPISTRDVPRLGDSVRRDIYVLVLDARANATTLRDFFGYDDREFTDSLRRLGFIIPARFHSNYMWTGLSLPSLLNFAHVNHLEADKGRTGRSSVARALVENNRSASYLKARGYEYHLFPSEWYGMTESSPLADHTFRAPVTLASRLFFGSELRRALFSGTPALRFPWFGEPTTHAAESFNGLKRVADEPRLTFALAHVLLPHSPYLFAADCRPLRQDPEGDIRLEKRLYIQQLRCTNNLVLDAVTEILARSERRPIVAIVGDHGSRLAPFRMDAAIGHDSPSLPEWYGALGAFLTPGAPEELFAGELTLVNVMQRLLTTYFGADIAPSADRFFVSERANLFDLQEIPPDIATGQPFER